MCYLATLILLCLMVSTVAARQWSATVMVFPAAKVHPSRNPLSQPSASYRGGGQSSNGGRASPPIEGEGTVVTVALILVKFHFYYYIIIQIVIIINFIFNLIICIFYYCCTNGIILNHLMIYVRPIA